MLDKFRKILPMILHSSLIVIGVLLLAGVESLVLAQAPTPTPEPEEKTYNGYKITGTTEIGWRWRALDGNTNQYKSTVNYDPGFRTFDSNLFMRSTTGKGKYFDSLLISNSGWGADPSGYTRVNMEKTGFYKFSSTVRKINYFNNLSSFIAIADPNQHTQNTKNTMGDFDITLLPQNDRLRINLGASFGNYKGPGTSTMRWNSDEFKVDTNNNYKNSDFRLGADGKLAGFDWSLTEGLRFYDDRTSFAISSLNQGHNATNTTAVSSFSRRFPVDGRSYFTQFGIHRTFAKKLDFTGRVIYSLTKSVSSLNERVSGRDASNNIIVQDLYTANANATRPQTRADLGITYNVTDALRISNTFTFDQFAVNSGERFDQFAERQSAAGIPISSTIAKSSAYRYEAYRRFMNTLEGDYQFSNKVSVHIGWRYTQRRVATGGYDRNTVTSVTTPLVPEEATNTTNTVIGGMKIKPVKNWTLYWDVEHGTADNVFTRLENYDFTNFRVRSRYSINKFSFDMSVITKNNSNPEFSATFGPSFGFTPITDIKSQFYSANVSWDPVSKVNISGGYTYRHQSTFTPIIFPYQCLAVALPTCTTAGGTVLNFGNSRYFMHDRYGYVEVAARPMNRVSFFATFRMDKDTGQDGLVSETIPNTSPIQPTGVLVYKNVIGGYPMTFITPEVRIAFRISRNIDWNVGYQYYNYKDVTTPSQSFRAHLPFTSLKFYFGGGVVDR